MKYGNAAGENLNSVLQLRIEKIWLFGKNRNGNEISHIFSITISQFINVITDLKRRLLVGRRTWKLSSESYIDRYRQDMGYIRSGPWGHPQSQELEMTNYLKKSLNPDPWTIYFFIVSLGVKWYEGHEPQRWYWLSWTKYLEKRLRSHPKTLFIINLCVKM